MPDFVRVKDTVTGHEYNVAESAVDAERHNVLSKSAYDHNGDLVPDKPNFPKGSAKSTRASAAPSQPSTPASEPTTKE